MIVTTKNGKLQGIEENGMLTFKGIPFAKAPVGELRFKPPVPADPWEGVLDALQFGNRSLQTTEQVYKDGINLSEDCLNLNIWTPAIDHKKRPVIFYIHGGGHFSGSNSDKFFDGPHLIRGREAVMVAPNYRLGALGYLYLADILGEEYKDSGNCGLLDQILALKWVNENIADFGGDPDMVILMGQSAGGKSVANIMVTPAAKGLFHRAIIQSGSVQCIRDTHTATMLAELVLEKLGVADTPKEVLKKSGEEVIAAQKEAYEVIDRAHLFGPVMDGLTILEEPKEYIEKGRVGDIPVLIGYNKEELYYSDPDYNPSDEESIATFQRCYGKNWEIVFRKYQAYKKEYSAATAFDMVQTLCIYGNASISLTQLLTTAGNKVWSYRWDYGGVTGRAQHFSEMPYLFGYITEEGGKVYDQTEEAIARKMNETWMNFICKGSPEHNKIPKWQPCTTSEIGYRMHMDKEFHLEQINLCDYDQELPMQVIKL
ncbi:MAG: carboxylesterase/lipase family protein [Mobilitalea sp.]